MMRLTTVILIATLMQVSAAGLAQKITMSKNQAPLRMVLRELRTQSGYNFVYADNILSKAKPVDISVKGVELEEVLKEIFSTQPLSYTIDNKTITVKEKETGFFENLIARFQSIDVRGKVVDQNGTPLPGATVKVKGGKATTTNANGEFSLNGIDDNAVLVISYIGYGIKELSAKSDLSNIVLQPSDSKLSEVQVIAYGKVEKQYSTSNISSLSAADIAKQPVSNPLLTLSGRLPGLFIQQTGGVSGSQVNVTVQGVNSMASGTEPFYVIDGMPYPSQNLGTISGTALAYSGGSTFNYINPADIESITILKDADATAIYGSRAANGAILITTKKGKEGKTVVNINSQIGLGKVTRKLDLMKTPQYLEMRNEAFKNAGSTPGDADYDVNGVWDQSRNTDWQDVLIGGTAKFADINASVAGGSANTQFRTGVGYNRQTTVYPGDLDDEKVNLTFSINHQSTNRKFKFNLNGTYLQDDNNLYSSDLMGSAIFLPPNAPAVYNEDGSLNWGQLPGNSSTYTFDNPLATIYNTYNNKTYNLLGNALVGYEILPGLELKSTFGYNRITSDEISLYPKIATRPDYNIDRSTNFSNASISSYIVEPQLTYNTTIFGGQLDALIGSTFQNNDNTRRAFSATGFSTDEQLRNIQAATKIILNNSLLSTYRYSAIFGRLNYRFKDKYVLNLTARRDGSSRFGSQNLFNTFYSAGGAWLFNRERFVSDIFPALSNGKLRFTYGTTGNDQIGNYGFLNLYSNFNVSIPYQGIVGLRANGFSNPYLQWEETHKLNIGLDLGFFHDTMILTTNYFQNRSSNQLLNDPVPTYTGFAEFKRNLPATVQNTGWEFLLNIKPITNRSFEWSTSVNLTIPKNKLISYPDLENSFNAFSYVIGMPANILKLYHFTGVSSQTGLYEFMGADGKATSDPIDPIDRTSLVDLNPKFYGGFNNSFSYNGFGLDFLFQFVKQTGINYTYGQLPGIDIRNQPATLTGRWTKVGDVAKNQLVSTDFGAVFSPLFAMMQSDAFYSDASYIRLKNVSLSYSVPSNWLQRSQITQAKFFVQAQNLLTMTNYSGSDPESQLSRSLPPLKTVTVGLQLTF